MSLYGVHFEGANWWLRSVVNGTNFANVNNNGNANNNNASNSNGIRPDFEAAKFLKIEGGYPGGKVCPCRQAKRQRESGAACASLPYVASYDEPITGA